MQSSAQDLCSSNFVDNENNLKLVRAPQPRGLTSPSPLLRAPGQPLELGNNQQHLHTFLNLMIQLKNANKFALKAAIK